ncbi:MAG: hypothetical protein BMS9Abin34_507 [Patescibacteria group bacterium]|nr:MAG: hypothetical protein BMS9Abin34_507 [Patescibacteria group bacterium]
MVKAKSRFDSAFLEEIRKVLTLDEVDLVKDIKQLTQEDPLLDPERSSAKISEYVEESEESQRHERIVEERGFLQNRLKETRLALSKMKAGKYGLCEICKKPIDRARLKANPRARYCIECEESSAAKEESA